MNNFCRATILAKLLIKFQSYPYSLAINFKSKHIDKEKDTEMDRQVEDQRHKPMDELSDQQTNEQLERKTDGQTNRHMDGLNNRWTADRQTCGKTDGHKDKGQTEKFRVKFRQTNLQKNGYKGK